MEIEELKQLKDLITKLQRDLELTKCKAKFRDFIPDIINYITKQIRKGRCN